MNEIAYNADWCVAYPTTRDVQETTRGLQRRLMCNWSWDLFVWDLKELRRLLIKCPAEYNYLYVTRFLEARATYLVLNGPFEFHATDMVTRLAQHNVQFVGIYRHLFICELERAKFVRHPTTDDRQDERFFQIVITGMEDRFRQLLQVIVCVNDPNFEILGHSIREWRAGQLIDKDRATSNLLPSVVSVKVQAEDLRSYRKIKPAPFDLGCKLMKKEPIYTIREHHGRETPCDMELERLCSWNAVKGHPTVRYGDDSFQYFAATVNESSNTLYVVCADRTLKMVNSNTELPGTVIREIHASWLGEKTNDYEVSFDNGSRGSCALSFRPHNEFERQQVPRSVSRQVNRRGLDIAVHQGIKATGIVTTEPESSIANRRQHGRKATKSAKLNVKIHRDFKIIEVGRQRIDLTTKSKRRAFLRFLHEEKTRTGKAEFYFEEMRDKFSEATGKTLKSDRLEDDLFKGQSKEFHLLFEELDRASGRYRLLI